MYLLRTIKITRNAFPLLKSDFVEIAPRNSAVAVFYHICPVHSSRGISSLCLVLHMVIRFPWLWTRHQSKLQHWLHLNDTPFLCKGYEVLISHKMRKKLHHNGDWVLPNGTTEQRREDSRGSLSSSSLIALTPLPTLFFKWNAWVAPNRTFTHQFGSRQLMEGASQEAVAVLTPPVSSGSAHCWCEPMSSTHPAGTRLPSLAVINILS